LILAGRVLIHTNVTYFTINNSALTTISGVVSNAALTSAGIFKQGTNTLILSGINKYSGDTTIGSGVLALSGSGSISTSPNIVVSSGAIFDVSGVTTVPYNLASGQTLKGTGNVHGKLVAASGATVAPGASIGTLTFDDNLTLSGITSMEINKTAATADKIVMSSGTVTLGGNLTVVNLAGTLALNDTFDLFDGTIAGGFTSFSLPSPPAGLAWDTSQLVPGGNGTIKVVCGGTLSASAGSPHTICSGTRW
jgi:autotransporter-associated beta strand protein